MPDPFDEDGYLKTGDILEIAWRATWNTCTTSTGPRTWLCAAAMKISAAELEGFVAGHPKVGDVAVVAYPDEVLGERVCAVVVPRPGQTVTLAEIVAYLRGLGIATFKLPERLELRDRTAPQPARQDPQARIARGIAPLRGYGGGPGRGGRGVEPGGSGGRGRDVEGGVAVEEIGGL